MAEFTLEEVDSDWKPSDGGRGEFKPLPKDRNWKVSVNEVIVEESPFFIDKDNEDLGKADWVVFWFEVLDDPSYSAEEREFVGIKVKGTTPAEFKNHPDCKLRNWTASILGLVDGIPSDFKFDTDYLAGEVAQIRVYHSVSKKNGRTYVNVADVLPAVDDPLAEEALGAF